ncbi:Protein of unknown function [Lactobacillus delbrueckii subsp. bulgaricus]|nr:Protein of unknown function [Lactobacillus delbrueckii subsp. bulgaricus]
MQLTRAFAYDVSISE